MAHHNGDMVDEPFSPYPKHWINVLRFSSALTNRRPKVREQERIAVITKRYLGFPAELWQKMGMPPRVSLFYVGYDTYLVPGNEFRLTIADHVARLRFWPGCKMKDLWSIGRYPDVHVKTIYGVSVLVIPKTNVQYVDTAFLEHWKSAHTRMFED